MIRARIAAPTPGLPRSARDTVALVTPQASAMSCKVTTPPEAGAEDSYTLELYAGQPAVACDDEPTVKPGRPALVACAGGP